MREWQEIISREHIREHIRVEPSLLRLLHSAFCILHSPSVLPWVAIEKALNPESGSIKAPHALRGRIPVLESLACFTMPLSLLTFH
jgi:hypothetical protein